MNPTDIPTPNAPRARIEIIPLIDVIFFLLATFVLFTLSLSKIAAITTPLPVSGGEGKDEMTAFVQASEGDTFFWKVGRASAPELISSDELLPRLVDYRNRVAEPRVFIRGDGKAKFGAAVRVLDEARKAGIAQISVETKPSQTAN